MPNREKHFEDKTGVRPEPPMRGVCTANTMPNRNNKKYIIIPKLVLDKCRYYVYT